MMNPAQLPLAAIIAFTAFIGAEAVTTYEFIGCDQLEYTDSANASFTLTSPFSQADCFDRCGTATTDVWINGTVCKCNAPSAVPTGENITCSKISCVDGGRCGSDDDFITRTAHYRRSGSGTGENDPHFITFDGLKYDSQTTCPYILSQPCNRQTYKAPYWSIKAKNSFLLGQKAAMVTFIELSFNGHTYSAEQTTKQASIIFKYDGTVKTVPHDDPSVRVNISGDQIFMQTDTNVKIHFKYAHQRVTVPSNHNHGTGVLCGLLGDFDGDCSNDLIGRDGKRYATPTKPACRQPGHGAEGLKAEMFADTWITEKIDNCVMGEALKKMGTH